LNKLQLEDTL